MALAALVGVEEALEATLAALAQPMEALEETLGAGQERTLILRVSTATLREQQVLLPLALFE